MELTDEEIEELRKIMVEEIERTSLLDFIKNHLVTDEESTKNDHIRFRSRFENGPK